MLGEIFYWLFNMSIVSSLAIVSVLLVRLIKSIPRRITRILWAIPLIRMLVPVGIGGKYGLMTLLAKLFAKSVTLYFPIADLPYYTMMNSVGAAESYAPIVYKADLLKNVFGISAAIWAIVFAAIVLSVIATYILTIKETKDASVLSQAGKNVYISDKLTSPAVYGIIKPKIILPASYGDMDPERLGYILAHERAHIRSCDNLLRLIAFLSAALHWFNPLSWIFLKCFLEDTEIACDEKALSRLGADKEEQKKYASVLLDCAEERSVFVSAFGGAKLRVRIERVLSFKKISLSSAVVFGALIAFIAYALLTNAV